MSRTHRAEALAQFRGAYGRLCTLIAQALRDGHDISDVRAAGLDRPDDETPPELDHLRRARKLVRTRLGIAVLENGREAIVKAALQAKLAVEEEWHMPPLPVRSQP